MQLLKKPASQQPQAISISLLTVFCVYQRMWVLCSLLGGNTNFWAMLNISNKFIYWLWCFVLPEPALEGGSWLPINNLVIILCLIASLSTAASYCMFHIIPKYSAIFRHTKDKTNFLYFHWHINKIQPLNPIHTR